MNLLSRTRVVSDNLAKWWQAGPVAFDEVYDRKNNAIGFLRVFFAVTVIIGHAFALGGFGTEFGKRISNQQYSLGTLAILGFFILSGFLITASFIHTKSTPKYLWRRFVRIMPGFWVNILITAFIFAPIFYLVINGTLAGMEFDGPIGSINYVKRNFFLEINQYRIDDLTKSLNAFAFNGSLWTLIHEARAYVILAVVGLFGLLKHRQVVLSGTFLLYLLHSFRPVDTSFVESIFPPFADVHFLRLTLFFFLGVTWYLYRDKIVLDNKYFIGSIVVLLLATLNGFFWLAAPVFFTYSVFYLAAKFPIKSFDKRADYSYGIYIYAFPVQQFLVLVGLNRYGYLAYTGLSIALTLPLAYLSFHLVEKQALKFKYLSFSRKKNGSDRAGFQW